MRILGKCFERIVVETAPGRLVQTTVDAVTIERGEVTGGLSPEDGRAVEADTSAITTRSCDHCGQNFGPRGLPDGARAAFQQFALSDAAPPWFGGREGWYCMSCSMPPR